MKTTWPWLAVILTVTLAVGARAQAPMDYGAALTYELRDSRSALIVQLAGDTHLYYDLHTLSVPAVWTGAFLDLDQTHHTEYKGGERARIAGTPLALGPLQWASEGRFGDLSDGAERLGPVESPRYRGHYIHGSRVVLSYEVGERSVLDMPGLRRSGGVRAATHTLRIGPGEKPLQLSLGRAERAEQIYRQPTAGGERLSASGAAAAHVLAAEADTAIAVGVTGAPETAQWRADEAGRLILEIPARSKPLLLQVFRTAGADPESTVRGLAGMVAAQDVVADPAALTKGGPARWKRTLTTSGTPGEGEGAYVLDELGLPFDNPWQSWMRPSGLDFFEDGRAAVSTLNGDVWIVSGIDASLEEVRWRRFATGLYEPLGLKVVGGTVYVQGRDRITRLHDQNGDGEADFYESFYAFEHVSRGYHAFTFGLDTDSEGNFYTALSGRRTDVPFPGALLRIAPDGRTSERLATGFRHPNGLTVDPDDRVFVSDNQGGWMPASKVSYVQEGRFYGYPGWEEKEEEREDFEPPVFWLPQVADNSSGGQVWAMDSRWGPLAGRMLHTSYGAATAFYTSIQEVAGALQGAVVPFPWQFTSGVMRARVNPADGQVYLIGQKGWGTRALEDGSFSRIRYTGRPARLLLEAGATPEGIRLHFSAPIDEAEARDASRYQIARWNYRWTENYGSPHYLPTDPEAKGEESVTPEAIRTSAGGRTVHLTLPDHRPVDQMRVDFALPAADGTPIEQTVYLTIKKIPADGGR